MDRLDLDTVETSKSSRSSNKKRKWREIEAIKDKIRLQKELQSIDHSFDLQSEYEY
ncbi:hypothetical protein OAG1_34530 [Agarivorans sp. OAG1]|jgi:hypothetical protein|uniref:DUF3545 domain-containing protein n=1 Tax=Agarivorans albus MKT 106 TaxID=1331007 RepID=R9PIK3_AGAAL|nr:MULTISPECIES: DUF3545 family protein [Agarivorans]MPW28222.1 DUF3545 family protein [Agarivorans sp. B2Z047]UQN43948.1 DUF3545 family protein [Agarivorans sp. B2Z047]BEU04653.1 hypothetical protein OAG1_34530 [Agarivorans sp. OAG1]GAD01088.1 hypothetical protein AALB_1168 [Agarivorans albus MKT 106]